MKVHAALAELRLGLQAARDMFAVAKVICDVGHRHLDVHQVAVHYHGASDQPFLVIDNMLGVPDEVRIRYLAEQWRDDPMPRLLRELHLPIGDDLTLALPILDPAGMRGVIWCNHLAPISDELRCALTIVAAFVAVRIAQLEIGAAADPGAVAELFPPGVTRRDGLVVSAPARVVEGATVVPGRVPTDDCRS